MERPDGNSRILGLSALAGLTQREGREGSGHAEWRQEHIGSGAHAGSHAVQIIAKVGDGCCELVHRNLEEGILLLH